MWLVLCHTDDLSALWAYQRLRERGLSPLELITAESLAFSLRWEHRINSSDAFVRLTVADGRQIDSRAIRGVLNRLQSVPLPHWEKASQSDRDYVIQEMNAFYTSWLSTLSGPVLNPATALGLSGRWRTPMEWRKLAADSGFATDGRPEDWSRLPAPSTVIVADKFVSPHRGSPSPYRRLSELSRTPILGIDVENRGEEVPHFVGATTVPDLRVGGDQLLDSLKCSLEA